MSIAQRFPVVCLSLVPTTEIISRATFGSVKILRKNRCFKSTLSNEAGSTPYTLFDDLWEVEYVGETVIYSDSVVVDLPGWILAFCGKPREVGVIFFPTLSHLYRIVRETQSYVWWFVLSMRISADVATAAALISFVSLPRSHPSGVI